MTNEEKRDQIYPYYEDMKDCELAITNAKRIGFMAGCEWKDEQYKWHKISDGDWPKIGNEILLYSEQYKVVQGYLEEDNTFFTHYGTLYDIIAWRELPEYEEE